MQIVQFSNRDYKLLKDFVQFQRDLYAEDKHFVPPLKADELGSRLLGEVGLLTDKHPFHKHAEVAYFMAYRDGRAVGRISAHVNRRYNDQQEVQDACFGHFECIDDYDVAKALLDKAAAWGAAQGMNRLIGPMSFSTNEVIGIQLNAYDTLPYFETAHTKPYYPALFERYGMGKAMDVIAQIMDCREAMVTNPGLERIRRIADQTIARNGISVREIQLDKLETEKHLFRDVYNNAWAKNWGAVGLSEEEFDLVIERLKVVADPRLVLLGFIKGEVAAVIAALPDINDCINVKSSWLRRFDLPRVFRLMRHRKKTHRGRLLLFGIKEKFRRSGLDAVMFLELVNRIRSRNQYEEFELSWLLETNSLIISAGEVMGGRHYKTWRVYCSPLAPASAGAAPETVQAAAK